LQQSAPEFDRNGAYRGREAKTMAVSRKKTREASIQELQSASHTKREKGTWEPCYSSLKKGNG